MADVGSAGPARRTPWRRLRPWLLGLIIFGSGVVTGGGLSLAMAARIGRTVRDPAQAQQSLVHILDRRLNLTDDQVAQVEAILRRHNGELIGLRSDMIAYQRRVAHEIHAVLTPAQRARFGRLVRRLERLRPGLGSASDGPRPAPGAVDPP